MAGTAGVLHLIHHKQCGVRMHVVCFPNPQPQRRCCRNQMFGPVLSAYVWEDETVTMVTLL